jgi:cell division protein FtsN
MKYLIGFVLGVLMTVLAYEPDTATQMPAEQLVHSVTEHVAEIDYTFYDNLSESSISVIKDAYKATLKKPDTGSEADAPKFYYVQIGAFSKQNNADSFRAEALLEGYLSADIFVESTPDVHRVMIGPFAQKHEAELAIDWASGKQFSGLLLARSD